MKVKGYRGDKKKKRIFHFQNKSPVKKHLRKTSSGPTVVREHKRKTYGSIFAPERAIKRDMQQGGPRRQASTTPISDEIVGTMDQLDIARETNEDPEMVQALTTSLARLRRARPREYREAELRRLQESWY